VVKHSKQIIFEEDESDKNIIIPHSKLPLIDPRYTTSPSLDELSQMKATQVKHVKNFVVSKDSVMMKFEHPVDLTGTSVKD